MENVPKIKKVKEPEQQSPQVVPPLIPPDLSRRKTNPDEARQKELTRFLAEHTVELKKEELHRKRLEILRKESTAAHSRHNFNWDDDHHNKHHADPVLTAAHRLSISQSPGTSSSYPLPKAIQKKARTKRGEDDSADKEKAKGEPSTEKKKRGSKDPSSVLSEQ